MDRYSKKITESIIIFYLLEKDMKGAISELSKDENHHNIVNLSLKSLYIDVNSFIDELEVFVQNLYHEEENFMSINRFLLLTKRVRKFLAKNKDGIKELRNLIYAHNYRDFVTKDFIDPNKLIALKHEKLPILITEVKMLGDVCLLIISKAKKCFYENDMNAYGHLFNSSEIFKNYIPIIQRKKTMVPDNYIELIENDMYSIDDHLRRNFDNYEIIAGKLKVKLKY